MRNDAEHDAVKSWADVTNDIYYNEFEVSTPEHDALLNVLGVDKPEIFSWPVTVVVKNGEGNQVTGPNSIYFIKRLYEQNRSAGGNDQGQPQPGPQPGPGP